MPPPHLRAPRRTSGRRGFALLITITLLAFLVLLLVSLSSLTRVETQVADNSKKNTQARQNALFALNLAVAALQKYAGPDQRVTATSSLGDASNLNGVPVSVDGKRHWVGVWGNGNASSANTGAPVLLNWLVSGNESASFTATNGAPPYSGVAGITFDSTSPIASLTSGSDASSSLGTTAQGWRLLVGANSTGGDVTRYVAAPLVAIEASSAQVPGLGGNAPVTVGRYAWWVGDENVKARVNLYNPRLAGAASELGSSFVVAQRSAGEWVDRQSGGTSLGSLYPALSDALKGVFSVPQLALASSDPAMTGATAKERFHDLTSFSYSVLADAAQGGLKKDLNRALAPDAPQAAETARGTGYAPPAARDWLFTPNNGGADSYGVPTWGLLRAYAGTQVAPGATIPIKSSVRATSGTHYFYDQAGINPVITYAGIGFDFTAPGNVAPPAVPVFPTPIHLNLFPVVVLWNPYTTPMAGGVYTAAIGVRSSGQLQLREGSSGGPLRAAFQLQWATFASTGSRTYFRFKLTCPVLAPGESRVFMLAGNTTYQPGLTELVEGLNPNASASMNTGASLANAADAAKDFIAYATNGAGTSALGGGELDAVLAEFDPTGAQPTGQDPETASPAWYAVAQRVGADVGTAPSARPLETDTTTADLRYGFRLRSNFPDSGSEVQLQWIAHANARASLMTRTKLDSWLKSDGSTAGNSPSYAGRFGAFTIWPDFSTTTARASTGTGLSVPASNIPTTTTLWEFPSPALGLLSLGQLQHAPVSLLGTYPSYAIGNSLADFHIPRTSVLSTTDTNPSASAQMATSRINTYYDLSWFLNRALWDRYFISSVPTGAAPATTTTAAWTQANIDSADPLPVARLHFYNKGGISPAVAQLRYDNATATSDPYNQAAANLLVAGGFNVNSTSEQAWRAVLGGVNQLAYDPQTRAAGSALQAAFSRFANPTADSALTMPWQGYRQLTEAQVRQLATNIVIEIKKRGPFLSLADFINRRLAADATGLKGTLQAALDATTTGDAANLATTAPFNANYVSAAPTTGASWDVNHMRNDLSNTAVSHRSRSALAPKFIGQADILSTLGPVLAARSDTFVIRTCGETVNPLLAATDAGYITGRAWCEAVVQRVPDYVDPADPARTTNFLGDAVAPSATNTTNQTFGRRFKIVSFRWLTPSDI
ncbi:MAG: hypothetical protein ACAH89_11255 [Rariglobus sp.]